MEEIQVKVEQSPGIIKCNFEEIKEALKVQMTAYTSLEITEADIKERKADLATLRKIRTAVDDERKKVKKEFSKPYDEFEAEVKEVLAVIDEPIDMINGKLKEFEARRIEEKQAHLHELYEANIGDFAEYLPYEFVANKKWDNATYSDKDILYDISEAIAKVRSDIDIIKSLGSEIEEDCLTAYKRTGNDLKAAIQKNNDYNAAKKLVEEKAKEEATKKAKEVQVEEVPVAEAVKEEPVELPKTEVKEEDVVYFKVTGKDNIQMIRDFCGLNGIEVEEVPG